MLVSGSLDRGVVEGALGPYLLDSQPIGSGGFADVYRGTELGSARARPRVFAIKVLRDGDPAIVKRFQREVRLLTECHHPHVVPVVDYGETGSGDPWFAMPLARGTLGEEQIRIVGNDDRIARIMSQVCSGLDYLHRQGIVHRDLKPANILRTSADTWAIADFGLAARRPHQSSTPLTSTEQGMGTAIYAAPETWTDAKNCGPEADIFSLGKVLLEMVTGEPPVRARPPEGRFFTILQKSLADNPADRYRSATEFHDALKRAMRAPDSWESIEQVIQRLSPALASEVVDVHAVNEFVDLYMSAEDPAIAAEIERAVPVVSAASFEHLAGADGPVFSRFIVKYTSSIAKGRTIGYGFSDSIANVLQRAALAGRPSDLTPIVHALVEMGHNLNRWHVRDTLLGVLQTCVIPEQAIFVAEGLRQCSSEAVRWSFSDFTLRSLHPTIREAVEQKEEAA